MLEFLSLHPGAFGLDISDLSCKAAQLNKTRKGLRLTSQGECAVPPGVINQGQIKDHAQLSATIRQLVASVSGEKIVTRHVVASLPEEQAFLQVVQLPRMEARDVEAAIRFEAENYIPYPLETVYIDFQIVSPVRNHLDHLDVLLAALPKTTVDPYVSVLQEAGLTPVALEIESLAVTRALVPHETASFPILLVDLGATRTSFIVFAGHSVRFTASIAVSSKEFSEAIAKTLQVDMKAAEELKIQYGLDERTMGPGKEVFNALVPALVDLVEQVRKYMGYYESHASHQHLQAEEHKIKKIVLCGGGANLRGIARFLTGELQREVVQGNPWVNIFASSLQELPPLPFAESLRFTTALGLSLRGLSLHD